MSPPLYSTDCDLGSEAASRPSNNRNRPPRVLSLALTRVSLDSHAAMCSSDGTDGCIRKCGGFILAYLVTGFSGVCRAHFALSFQTSATYEMFKNKSIKKRGCGPEARSGKRQRNKMGPHPRSNSGGKITKSGYGVNKRVRLFRG